jgi:nickel-dependent lactate racemase
MTQSEVRDKLGAEIARDYSVVNVSSAIDSELVYLGVSANGIPAYVNRAVAEADVRIGLGQITPHLDAGFSGGMKIVLPGVCGARTVDAFHARSAFVAQNQLGRIDAPLRRALEQFVGERAPLTFIVNVIMTPQGQLAACVAGHPLQAHRAGVKQALAVFSAPARQRYPIVVANCHPYDVDLWQSIKGIWAGDLVTADGGTLIAVTAAPEGNSTYPLVPGYAGRDPDEVKREIETGAAEDDKQAATGVMLRTLLRRIRLALVSEGLTAGDAGAMGIDHYPSVEAAVAAEIARLPIEQRPGAVGIVPRAGIVLPVIEQAC